LNATPLAPGADWINGYRRFREHSFDGLAQQLARYKGGASHD
jgi:hypothetical protein